MKHQLKCLGIVFLFLAQSLMFGQESTKKLLIYTKNGKGYVHKNIATSVTTLQKICSTLGVKTVVSDDPSIFTSPEMASIDAIFFSNTNNEAFDTQAQKDAFQAFCRSGKGFGGLHSASGSERQWPWYWNLLGGKFIRHAPFQKFTVKVVDANHPSTKNLPARFEVEDECYYSIEMNPDIHVLLAADMTTVEDPKKGEYPSNIFNDSFPLAWCHQFEGGKQWYSSLGHPIEAYSLALYQEHLRGGIQYILSLKE
ncbi:MAG: ThuA domain-containing protein [Flavobacteriaceae bacterium]